MSYNQRLPYLNQRIMLIQGIVEKISDSIEDLGRVFDQIYKMPTKLREKYFDQIQKLKDRLIALKTNAKESNKVLTQKNYKQIYLNLHRLKEEISDEINTMQAKENRDINRPNLRETRKNHEDAMKLIVDKDKQIEQLNGALYEKEELIKINFEELKMYKKENAMLSAEYHQTKNILSRLEIEYSSLKSVFVSTESANLDLKLRDQQRERCFRQVLEEANKMKQELMAANDRIVYLEELADANIKKNKAAEENIKMVELEAQQLNQNYRKKEGENMKKKKEIEELEAQISQLRGEKTEMQLKIERLHQQMERVEYEREKLEKIVHQQRSNDYELRNQKEREISQLQLDLQDKCKENDMLSQRIQHLQTKQEQLNKTITTKDSQIKDLLEQLEQTKQKVEEYLMMTVNLQTIQEECSNQLNVLRREKDKYDERLSKSINLTRQLEMDIANYKDKLRVKQEEKARLSIEVEKYQRESLHLERDRQIQQRSLQALKNDNTELKTLTIELQQSLKQKQREMQSLKMRFLRAKIQIIHQIRQQLN